MGRYELTDSEWKAIEPCLPNKPRGVPRVNDRRVLNGIFWVLRSGARWADLPERYGPPTTIYNRFNRWRKAGVWDRLRGHKSPRRERSNDLRRSFASINKVQRQKGGSRSMSGSLPRWAHDQNPCARRSPRAADPGKADGRTGERHRQCPCHACRSAERSDATRRQGL
jgi:transposase